MDPPRLTRFAVPEKVRRPAASGRALRPVAAGTMAGGDRPALPAATPAPPDDHDGSGGDAPAAGQDAPPKTRGGEDILSEETLLRIARGLAGERGVFVDRKV